MRTELRSIMKFREGEDIPTFKPPTIDVTDEDVKYEAIPCKE